MRAGRGALDVAHLREAIEEDTRVTFWWRCDAAPAGGRQVAPRMRPGV